MAMEKITNAYFNKLDWHDAIIDKITIDRSCPGVIDIIDIHIIWKDETKNTLHFENVYWADLNMNFGVVAAESIVKAISKGRDCIPVIECYNKWKGNIDNINLNYYEIETNSTGSTIRIIAEWLSIT